MIKLVEIDEEMKNKILNGTIRVLKDWVEEKTFTEPRKRWFRTGKGTVDGKVHCLISVIVGKDEEETSQILDDLIKIEEKYTADQKDIKTEEDYAEKRYLF